MKKVKLLVVLGSVALLGFMLTGCDNHTVVANGNTGTVNMAKVLRSKTVVNLEKSMQAADKGDQQAIQTAYLSMQHAQKAAQKATGKEKADLALKAKTAQAKFTQLLQQEQTAAREHQEVLMQKIKKAIATTAKEMHLSSVLLQQAVLYHAGNSYQDITDSVIKDLGNS